MINAHHPIKKLLDLLAVSKLFQNEGLEGREFCTGIWVFLCYQGLDVRDCDVVEQRIPGHRDLPLNYSSELRHQHSNLPFSRVGELGEFQGKYVF